jgi:hypothetical protein
VSVVLKFSTVVVRTDSIIGIHIGIIRHAIFLRRLRRHWKNKLRRRCNDRTRCEVEGRRVIRFVGLGNRRTAVDLGGDRVIARRSKPRVTVPRVTSIPARRDGTAVVGHAIVREANEVLLACGYAGAIPLCPDRDSFAERRRCNWIVGSIDELNRGDG